MLKKFRKKNKIKLKNYSKNNLWKNKKWMNVYEEPEIEGRKTLLTFNPFLNSFTPFMIPILSNFLSKK